MALEIGAFPSPNGGDGSPHVYGNSWRAKELWRDGSGSWGCASWRCSRSARPPPRAPRPASKSASAKKSSRGAKAGFKGRYKDKICSEAEKASPEEVGLGGPSNKYEWHAGPGANPAFSGKTGKTSKVIKFTSGQLEVVCKSSEASGGVRGAETIEASFSFKKCLQPKNEKKPCGTHGKEAGEIVTDKLLGKLSEGLSKEPLITFAHLHAGVANPEEPWVEFECIEKKFTVTGSLGGKSIQVENEMTKKSGVEFTELVGEQGLIAEFPNPFNSEEKEKEPLTVVFEEAFKPVASFELRTT